MEQENIQQARDSLSRCLKQPKFLDRFYELFLSSSPEIQKKFESTDFERQKQVLKDSLFLMMASAGTTKGFAHAELAKLAERHSRDQLDIHPEWYGLWLDCLLKTVREQDPDYSSDLDAAWRNALHDGIELLKSKY